MVKTPKITDTSRDYSSVFGAAFLMLAVRDRSYVCTVIGRVTARELQPPDFETMYDEMKTIIAKLAVQYSDDSCPNLCFDELLLEGNQKLSELITKGYMERIHFRKEWFKMFKASVNNHFRTLVQKHRGTQKRTGVVQPKKGEGTLIKPSEVRIDNEETPFEISYDDDTATAEVFEEWSSILTPLEKLVLKQELTPNAQALNMAYLESLRGKTFDSPAKIKISKEINAAGLGLTKDLYVLTLNKCKHKIKNLMSKDTLNSEKNERFKQVISRLSAIFSLHIPPDTEIITVKRLLTIAARHQYALKVRGNKEVARLLKEAGIRPPENNISGDSLQCFGVMYQERNRICTICHIKTECAAEAANVGLGDYVISKKMLSPSKNPRTPMVVPQQVGVADMKETTQLGRDEKILDFINSNFKKVSVKGGTNFTHNESIRSNEYVNLFGIGEQPLPLLLKFYRPSADLMKKLTMQNRGRHRCYYLPDSMKVEDAVECIRQHADEVFTKS